MNATLSFALPDESYEHDCAVHGVELARIALDLDETLRVRIKHGDLPEAVREALQAIRDELGEAMRDVPVKWGG